MQLAWMFDLVVANITLYIEDILGKGVWLLPQFIWL